MTRIVIAFGLLVIVVGANPSSRQKRYDAWDGYNPSVGAGAYSGVGNGFAAAGGFGGFGPFINPLWPTSDVFPRVPPMTYSPFPFFFPVPSIPWYKGPNVCVEKRMIDEPEVFKQMMDDTTSDNFHYKEDQTICHGTDTSYICRGTVMTNSGSKMFMTKYQCCHGFVRALNGQPGCIESDAEPTSRKRKSGAPETTTEMNGTPLTDKYRYDVGKSVDMKDLVPTLRDLGATSFVEMADQQSILDKLHEGNYTVFCPNNAALETFVEGNHIEDNEVISEVEREDEIEDKIDLSKVLLSHLAEGFLRTDDVEDEQILKTDNPEFGIRINVYFIPEKLMTANCAPLTSVNNYARNGIVHMVDRVLPMTSRTVADIIAGDSQFSILKGLLSKAGLVQALRNSKGNFTVFAATDSVFEAEPALLERLQNGSICSTNIMKHHILEHVICSTAIPDRARSSNMIGEMLSLTRKIDNKLYVDGAQVVVRDLMGTNGVVHVIDGLLIPNQAKSIIEILEEVEMTEFLDLVDLAGLKSTFDDMKNVSFFIPSDDAIRQIPPQMLQDITSDTEKLKETLLYHVAIPQIETCEEKENGLLNTKVENKTIKFHHYGGSFPFSTKQMIVHCGKILSPDNKLCGSVLHVVDRLLIPPKGNIMETLESMQGFSIVVRILENSGLYQRLSNLDESFTFLAPTDDAFQQMRTHSVEELLKNRMKAIEFLKMHIISKTLCCDEIRSGSVFRWHQIRTIDGSLLDAQRSLRGTFTIGPAQVVQCDVMADNGIIHVIDKVVYPEKISRTEPDFLEIFKGYL